MKNLFLLYILPRLYKLTLILLVFTCRVRWHNREVFDQYARGNKAYIIAVWHENVLIGPWFFRNLNIASLISHSRDGEYITRVAQVFKIWAIRGGSSSGSSKATRAALRRLKKGQPVGITPDGPRGPARKLQDGVIWLSALGQAPIVAMHIEASRQWRAGSWDGQKLPLPFSTIHFSVAEPFYASREQATINMSQVAAEFEDIMNDNVAFVEEQAQKS